MGLFFYTKKGSIISTVDLPTTEIIEPKKLFVWTINSPDKIRYYLQTPIDGLITDELKTTNQTKNELGHDKSYIDRLLDLIQPLQ